MKMKKVNILIIVLMIGNMIFGGECMAMQETEKLSKPQIAPDKTFVQSKKVTYKNKGKLTVYKNLYSSDVNSVIYYSLNGKEPKEYGEIYKKQITLALDYKNEFTLQAINTKEGCEDSDVIERKYSVSVEAKKALIGIKVRNVNKNRKTISGTLKKDYLTKKYNLVNYIKLKIKKKNGDKEEYITKVNKGKWSIKLKSKIKQGDKLIFNATTKDCVIYFKKENKRSNLVFVIAREPCWATKKFVYNNGKLKQK